MIHACRGFALFLHDFSTYACMHAVHACRGFALFLHDFSTGLPDRERCTAAEQSTCDKGNVDKTLIEAHSDFAAKLSSKAFQWIVRMHICMHL